MLEIIALLNEVTALLTSDPSHTDCEKTMALLPKINDAAALLLAQNEAADIVAEVVEAVEEVIGAAVEATVA